MKNENAPIPQPFLDWYDIWPGQAGRDEHGRSWLEAPPQGVRLRVQPARMSDIFFQPERPWEAGGLGPKVILFDEGSLPHVVWSRCLSGFPRELRVLRGER